MRTFMVGHGFRFQKKKTWWILHASLLTWQRGLAISDFWMAINFLSSAAMNLSGKPIGTPKQEQFCSFNGFMIQVFVVQSKQACAQFNVLFYSADPSIADYWVFAIAVCTYLILADHKKWSNWIQDRKYIVWILPWLFSLLWALLGLTLVGYGDIGACTESLIALHSKFIINTI